MPRRDDVLIEIRKVNVYVHQPAAGLGPQEVADLVARQVEAVQEALANADPEEILGEGGRFEESDVDGVEERHESVPADPISSWR